MGVGPYLLGIDVGTTVSKSVVIDYEGNEVAVARYPTAVKHPIQSFSEIDMLDVWKAVCSTIQELIHLHKVKPKDIKGIGISSCVAGVWLLNEKKAPFRNAILWNDGRAASLLGKWEQQGIMQEIFDISANAIFPGMTLPSLRWLAENEPETLREARYLFCGKDWVRFQLTGEIHSDISDLSQMPCDARTRGYSQKLFELCGIEAYRHLFPAVVESDMVIGGVTKEAAQATGLLEGTPVVVGLADVQASMLGAGATRFGDAGSIIGTSALNNVVMDYACFEPSGVGFMFMMAKDIWLRSLTNTSGTINLEWFMDNFCMEEKRKAQRMKISVYKLLENQAASIPIGSGGVIYHPYINTTGVAAPFRNAAARAQFFGIEITHNRNHLLRAVYEGLALAMRELYNSIPAEINEVMLTGGGARSPFWCQMFADCTGKRMIVPEGEEFGGKGVGILAGLGTGVYKDLEDARAKTHRIAREYEPDRDKTAQYDLVFELYRSIHAALQEQWWQRHNMLANLSRSS